MNITRPTVMEVDLNAFEYNIKQIKNIVGSNVELMPVVKANAYGTYINKVNEVIDKFKIVGVATIDEAVELRIQGYNKEIFVLNQPYFEEIEKILDYNITIGVSSEEFINKLGTSNKNVSVHIEIETGMARTGIKPEKIVDFIDLIKKYSNIKICGIYTHLSSADCDDEFTQKQLKIFEEIVNKAKTILGDELKYIHCSASNGILNYPNSFYNLVRPGLIMYGYEPFEGASKKIDLKPTCVLKSKIVFLKELDANVSIGYSRTFITNRKSKIATVPIGYADGLKRILSNKGHVLINGIKAPIVGNICMDGFMVDVTEVENVSVGDDVYIWDNTNIKLSDIAKSSNTINYEIISTISSRVPRVFIRK